MKNKSTPNLEETLKRIREITEKMQGGQIGFDENVGLFKEGVKLLTEARSYLDQSEMLINQLIQGEKGDEEQPFEA